MVIVGNILTICQEDGSKVDTSFSKLYQTQNNWMERMVFRCLKNWNWDQKIFLFTWGIYKGSKQPHIEESCRWKAGWREIKKVKAMQKKTVIKTKNMWRILTCTERVWSFNFNINLWLEKASVLKYLLHKINVAVTSHSEVMWGRSKS